MRTRLERGSVDVPPGSCQLLPLRFHRFGADQILVTNLVVEHTFLTWEELQSVVDGTCRDQRVLAELRARHLIQLPGERMPADLLAVKLRTRHRRLSGSTGLHMF